jgi:transketolase N-terminal domain/subunit
MEDFPYSGPPPCVQASYRTYCLMGDGESMEGSVWEALHFAGYYKLDNLCAIIDVNRLDYCNLCEVVAQNM